ncbi:hypothetical protein F5Y19DRAFT_230897 [Xylariaceae sp. FL1651]|nr:hypothetical protein F5Y19DRAFT_230897 [Xylariaceae sp. FL1651]
MPSTSSRARPASPFHGSSRGPSLSATKPQTLPRRPRAATIAQLSSAATFTPEPTRVPDPDNVAVRRQSRRSSRSQNANTPVPGAPSQPPEALIQTQVQTIVQGGRQRLSRSHRHRGQRSISGQGYTLSLDIPDRVLRS